MVARTPGGGWSAPAFCTIGGASAGIQFGYQDASVVLVFMSQPAFRAATERGLKLGADASIAAGSKSSGASSAGQIDTSRDIYEFVDAGGVFAGVALDGSIVGARESHNRDYYGSSATTAAIVLDRRFDRRGTEVLKEALTRSS